jgi:hypothetical protein
MKSGCHHFLAVWAAFLLVAGQQQTAAFAPGASISRDASAVHHYRNSAPAVRVLSFLDIIITHHPTQSYTSLSASEKEEEEEFETLSTSSQTIVGAAGTLAALIVFYSEFALKTTGCGVPAGPFGIFGLAEGFSYVGVTGLAAYSLVSKVKTVSLM